MLGYAKTIHRACRKPLSVGVHNLFKQSSLPGGVAYFGSKSMSVGLWEREGGNRSHSTEKYVIRI